MTEFKQFVTIIDNGSIDEPTDLGADELEVRFADGTVKSFNRLLLADLLEDIYSPVELTQAEFDELKAIPDDVKGYQRIEYPFKHNRYGDLTFRLLVQDPDGRVAKLLLMNPNEAMRIVKVVE